MRKNKIEKVIVFSIFVVLMIASAVQAVVKDNNIEEGQENLNSGIGDIAVMGGLGVYTWEDNFNDQTKIDPNPPGVGKSENYQVADGEVTMINTYSAWSDPAWTRMKILTLTNNEGQILYNYVLHLNVDYDSDMQDDYDDIRFKHEEDTSDWLDYWIETYDSSSASVWIEIPTVPIGQSEMYLFYGNPSASSESNFYGVYNWELEWYSDAQISYNENENKYRAEDPDVCYGSNVFLVTWEEGQYPKIPWTYYWKHDIKGIIYNPDGSIAVSEFYIRQGSGTQWRHENPQAAYGGGKWLVTWQHFYTSDDAQSSNIIARWVTTSGGVGTQWVVCEEPYAQGNPEIVFDSVNNRFFIVWEDARNTYNNYNIYGKLYDTNGNQVGGEKSICTDTGNQCEPWVAFDPINERYMIAWEEGVTADAGPFDIYVGLFDENLNCLGPGSNNEPLLIADGNADTDYNFPCVSFCEETERFLVTWNDGDISDGDYWGNVWGRIFDSSGTTVKDNWMIKTGNYVRTDIVPYLSSSFLVSFDDADKIWSKLVSSDGDVFAGDLQISASSEADADWASIAVGGNTVFAGWEDLRIEKPYPWNGNANIFGNIWHLDIPDGSEVSYVYGDEVEIVLSAYVTSVKIQPTEFTYWDEFNAIFGEPSGSSITFDILDGDTGGILISDISPSGGSLQGITASSIRLMASFSRSKPSDDPYIDKWSADWFVNDPPYTPSNPYPSNGAVNVDRDADLSWTGGDPNGDTVTYDVYFGTSSTPPKVSSNQTGTSYNPGLMNHNTKYYWKIVSWDEYDASAEGPIWDFTTEANNPPNTPSSPYPANGAINVVLDVVLSWTGGDPDGDPVTYDVYFGTVNPPTTKVSSNQSGTSYDPPGDLTHSTIYYWRIVSWDVYGASAVGPIWSFTTKVNNPPNTPSGPYPSNGATDVDIDVDLSWTGGDPDGDPVTYDVYFGDVNPPPKMVTNQSGTAYDPGVLDYGTTYYWKIVAWDCYGASTSGPLWQFTTESAPQNDPPNPPNSPDPYDGETGVDIDADLSWDCSDPNGDPLTYDVYFGTTNPPTTKVSANQSGTSYNPGTMNYITTYYWRIVAWDDQGASTSGPLWYFTTESAPQNDPPNIPSNPHPEDGETNVYVNTDLVWTGGDPNSGDIVTYDVYFGTSSSPPLVSSNQTGTTYEPGMMSYNTTYYWRIKAWDNHGASAEGPTWSFTTGEKINTPPNPPEIMGPQRPQANYDLDYQFVSTDPESDDVYYYIEWGDGTTSNDWVGPYNSGETAIINHTWPPGINWYIIKAKARDTDGAESDWGQMWVILSKNKVLTTVPLIIRIVERLMERFPLFEKFISSFPIIKALIESY